MPYQNQLKSDYYKNYWNQPHVKKRRADYHRRYFSIKENNFKMRCRKLLEYAVVSGKINRLPCEVCGKIPTHGHHSDYSKPLEVTWLCLDHHKEAHSLRGE